MQFCTPNFVINVLQCSQNNTAFICGKKEGCLFMINISGKSLCENCFSEITSEPCPVCGYSPQDHISDPTVLSSGSVLQGRYAVGRVIGKGGFGVTYLAYDIKHDEKIAVKEYYPYGIALRNPESTIVSVSTEEAADIFKSGAEKFYDEARLVAAFNGNPSIVSVYDFFYENDTVYYTMEYLEGQTLKDYVEKNGVITSEQAVYIAEKISSALMTAHSANILHRDVSPDNIMICSDGKVKLLDFGAARQVVANASQSLSVILKQGFAPLEQYQKKGRQGPWTDIYSLGATLYFALTKDIPDDPMTRFESDDEYSSNKYSIVQPLWEIIRKATMLRIEDRYSNIFEFRSDLASSGITAEPLVEFEAPEKIVLPSGVTAKPYSTTASMRTSKKSQTEQRAAVPPVAPPPVQASQTPVVPTPPSEPAVSENTSAEENASPEKKPAKKKLTAILACAAALIIIVGAAVAVGVSKNNNAAVSTSVESENVLQQEDNTPQALENKEESDKKNYYDPNSADSGGVNGNGFTPIVTDDPPDSGEKDEEISEIPTTDPTENIPEDTTTTTVTQKQEEDFVTIAGKQYKKNMTGVLNVRSSDLTNSDIKQMKYLTDLTEIIMSDNPKVTDLSPLSALTGLEKITFHNCNVKDISFTANMKNLTVIGAENNGITDISALADHKKLTDVWMQFNNVKDISPLKDSTEMVNICFTNNLVSDISALSGMNKLVQINFTGCKVKSLDALKNCTTIELAYLGENQITDLTPLANSKGLKKLYASNNALNGNVKALKGLTILEFIDLSGNNYDSDELFEYLCYEIYTDSDSFLYSE